MKDLPKRVLFGAIVTLLLLSCTATPVLAFDTGSVGGKPAYPQKDNPRSEGIFIRTIDPGKTVDDGLLLVNYRDDERTVAVHAVDSMTSTDGSFDCKQDSQSQSEVGTWIKLSSEKVVLASQENKVIPFTITVPEGAAPGEHGGCISIQDQANLPSGEGAGVKLGFRTAIRVAITVPGDIVKEAVIEKVAIARNQAGNTIVSPVIRNKGNVSLDIVAHAQLESRLGQKTPIKDADFPVMNGQSTGWNFEFERPFWGGWYRARILATYNENTQDGLGINADKSKKTLSYTSGYFFVLPSQKGMTAISATLAAPILFLFWFIMWRKRRKKRAEWELHVVEPQDTIMSLAAERGVKWKKIARFNKIRSPYLVQTGQKIFVPPTAVNKRSRRKKKPADIVVAEPAIVATEPVYTHTAPPEAPKPPRRVVAHPEPAKVPAAAEDTTPAYLQALAARPYSSRPMTYRGSMSYDPDPSEIAQQIVAAKSAPKSKKTSTRKSTPSKGRSTKGRKSSTKKE